MIRLAEKKDVPAVAEIYRRIHECEQRGEMTIGWLPGVYPVEATAQAALDRGDLYVCEEEGHILASAVINTVQVPEYALGRWTLDVPEDKVLVLHTLVVLPDARSRGLGRRFVAYYEALAAARGCTALRMDTNAKNLVAREFYRKLGYREIGVVPCTFNGIPGVQLVLLEKAVC